MWPPTEVSSQPEVTLRWKPPRSRARAHPWSVCVSAQVTPLACWAGGAARCPGALAARAGPFQMRAHRAVQPGRPTLAACRGVGVRAGGGRLWVTWQLCLNGAGRAWGRSAGDGARGHGGAVGTWGAGFIQRGPGLCLPSGRGWHRDQNLRKKRKWQVRSGGVSSCLWVALNWRCLSISR